MAAMFWSDLGESNPPSEAWKATASPLGQGRIHHRGTSRRRSRTRTSNLGDIRSSCPTDAQPTRSVMIPVFPGCQCCSASRPRAVAWSERSAWALSPVGALAAPSRAIPGAGACSPAFPVPSSGPFTRCPGRMQVGSAVPLYDVSRPVAARQAPQVITLESAASASPFRGAPWVSCLVAVVGFDPTTRGV